MRRNWHQDSQSAGIRWLALGAPEANAGCRLSYAAWFIKGLLSVGELLRGASDSGWSRSPSKKWRPVCITADRRLPPRPAISAFVAPGSAAGWTGARRHGLRFGTFRLVKFHSIAYVRQSSAAEGWTRRVNPAAPPRKPAAFTERQGQYLAFIHTYTKISGRPPAEADMQRYFHVTPPTVHQMVLNLHQAGLIERVPGQARSIRVLVDPDQLPALT